jgi:very-short-patch-repair endonuclease
VTIRRIRPYNTKRLTYRKRRTLPRPFVSARADVFQSLTFAEERWRTARDELRLGSRASQPEVLAVEWLLNQGRRIIYQFSVWGGRRMRGGAVLDIAVVDRTPWLIIRIQSAQWHPDPEEDAEERLRLMLQGYEVVDVWEPEILRDVNAAMTAALAGISVRP